LKVKLSSVARILRSKNAGPFKLTIDIILPSKTCLEEIFNQLDKETIIRLFKLKPDELLSIVKYEPVNAIKINIIRRVPAGNPGDTDVYGAQQHAPLLDLEVNVSEACIESAW
jgi:hypothetical protein